MKMKKKYRIEGEVRSWFEISEGSNFDQSVPVSGKAACSNNYSSPACLEWAAISYQLQYQGGRNRKMQTNQFNKIVSWSMGMID